MVVQTPESGGVHIAQDRPAEPARLSVRLFRYAIVVAAYFLAGKIGLKFAFLHVSASVIWPATGVAMALLLLWGTRLWPAILVSSFLVNITTAGSVFTALGIATGNTLEALVGVWLVQRFAGGRQAFQRARDVVRFWFLAGVVATAVSATIGVASLCVTGYAHWSNFSNIWLTWWLGDAVGGFSATAMIILWASPSQVLWSRQRVLEAILFFGVFTATTLLIFNGLFPTRTFFLLPLLLWSAFRFGPRETITAILIMAVVATWCTLHGKGPFAALAAHDALFRLQTYLAVMAVTKLTVASVVAERQQAVSELRTAHDELDRRVHKRTAMLSSVNDALRVEIGERRRAEDRFRRLLESAPDAMIIADVDGRVQLVNSQTERMFRYTREQMIGRPVEMLVPERKRGVHASHRGNFAASPQARPMGRGLELRGLRADGSEFPVEIALSPIEVDEGLVICAAIRDTSEKKELEARLMAVERRRADDMRDLAAAVQGAQEEERRRIARELHDDLGQRLAALKMSMALVDGRILEGAELERNRPFMDSVDLMIAEVRRMSYNLRPLALDDFGLSVALDMLCKEFARLHNLKTSLHVSETLKPFADPQLDIALYRVAQGALANVARHAVAASVSVRLSEADHTIELSVEDDGCGFDAAQLPSRRGSRSGTGLISMRERTEMLGGTFEVHSVPDQGTRIRIQIPLVQPRAEDTEP